MEKCCFPALKILRIFAEEGEGKLFTNQQLKKLVIPLVIEQVLASLVGTVDTMMVSTLGAAEVSGVSLVNSIDTLMIYLLTALATGGTIVCSQYLGAREREGADNAARQLHLATFVLAIAVTALCLLFRRPLLQWIFGSVEDDVMQAAQTYFLITALSYPGIGLYNAGAALYRVTGNSKLPMKISLLTNLVNIFGNAILMFVLGLGVAGAAISTLVSRTLGAVIILTLEQRPGQTLQVGSYLRIRPDLHEIGTILRIGIPTGLENSLFQVGKLAVQSTVSTLGTTAIAAQAMTIVLEAFTSMPSMAVGLALTTVAGQCIGAGKPDEARFYIKKLCRWSWIILLVASAIGMLATWPVTVLGNMTEESAELCIRMMLAITFIKPLFWVQAFTLPSGMRAAGDVTFAMAVSIVSMWVFRVGGCMLLCRVFGFGPMGVWIGMFTDWAVRGFVFLIRFRGDRWIHRSVVQNRSEL